MIMERMIMTYTCASCHGEIPCGAEKTAPLGELNGTYHAACLPGMPAASKETMTIWVCQCCMLMHANGECCADDQHGGDGIGPWALPMPDGQHVAMGLRSEGHADDCLQKQLGWADLPDGYECDCEANNYSTSQCEGCGSYLHGERHAFTLWYPSA